jgi:hypothetical protein
MMVILNSFLKENMQIVFAILFIYEFIFYALN